MSKVQKLFDKIMTVPQKGNIKWTELEKLLTNLDYKKIEAEGSRVKFFNEKLDNLIEIHKPHPGNELKKYQVKQIQNILIQFFTEKNF